MNVSDRKANRIIFNRLKLKSGVKAATTEEMKTYFQKFGSIVDINASKGTNTGFVEFSSTAEAERALAQPIHSICGCNVRIFAPGTSKLPK